MARFSEMDRSTIDTTTDLWRSLSLLQDSSFTHPDSNPNIWNRANVQDLHDRFILNPLEGKDGGGTFATKWQIQLEGAPSEVRLLAGELLLIYYLITSTVNAPRKIEMINETIRDEAYELDPRSQQPFVKALSSWIANPGSGYNTNQDRHIAYLIDLTLRLKRLGEQERRNLLHNTPWGFGEFADNATQNIRVGTMRHVICHLLYPEHFERITSTDHKNQVHSVFQTLLGEQPAEASIDEHLFQIRQILEDKTNSAKNSLDYYREPLEEIWRPVTCSVDSLSPIAALEHKRQIVLYGPPGTGKTFRATHIAESLIRGAALKRWGVDGYFQNLSLMAELATTNVTRLQLHPGFGYQEFIGGLKIGKSGSTEYQPGVLPRLIAKMNGSNEGAMARLPHVLILDEINRTDLSAMFGEAFSALEADKREYPITLSEKSIKDENITLKIPNDLYLIGTMNEIDQSVEALDFALRRRFLWFAETFSRDALLQIWQFRWQTDPIRISYEEALNELERLSWNIEELNSKISGSPELGPGYVLGQAFFADLPFYIRTNWPTRRPPNGLILWNKKREPLMPLRSIWHYEILPLLEQYLAISDERDQTLQEFQSIFYNAG